MYNRVWDGEFILIYNKYLAILSYLTVCVVWGSTYLAIRVGVTDMPFLVFAGVRFFSAGSTLKGPNITATATDAEGNTSILSKPAR